MNDISLPRAFSPSLPRGALNELTRLLGSLRGTALSNALRLRAEQVEQSGSNFSAQEAATLFVLADLADLHWKFKVAHGTIYMLPRSFEEMDHAESKVILRSLLRDARDLQLQEPGTRSFLEAMYSKRLYGGRQVNIENLIDDGPALANAIREARNGDLYTVVDPYVQIVHSTEHCEFTGLKLNDVWRFFRHTWSLLYRPTPGRNINFLIRNAARPDHPVMGIIGLANAVFQLTVRDSWIGWTPEQVVRRIQTKPEYWGSFLESALRCLTSARDLTRSEDLKKEVGRTKSALQLAERYEALAHKYAQERKKALTDAHQEGTKTNQRDIPKFKDGTPDWKKLSSSDLYKRKRAELLGEVTLALHVLERLKAESVSPLDIVEMRTSVRDGDEDVLRWKDVQVEKAFKIAVREMKKNGVATRILDVNVCGATPAYREILGGKLAALSLFSREIQEAYVDRYGSAPSEIASGMAGRAIEKKGHICVLTTTSLYGGGSSQYNRLKVVSSDRTLEWKRIGETRGFGTLHLRQRTIDAVRRFAVATAGMRNVNNRFGEGASPLMRQLREGLDLLGFQSDDVLHHSHKRLVYAAELYKGACDDLALDLDNYVEAPAMKEIGTKWVDRWLRPRVQNEEILVRVSACTADSVRDDLTRGDVSDV